MLRSLATLTLLIGFAGCAKPAPVVVACEIPLPSDAMLGEIERGETLAVPATHHWVKRVFVAKGWGE